MSSLLFLNHHTHPPSSTQNPPHPTNQSVRRGISSTPQLLNTIPRHPILRRRSDQSGPARRLTGSESRIASEYCRGGCRSRRHAHDGSSGRIACYGDAGTARLTDAIGGGAGESAGDDDGDGEGGEGEETHGGEVEVVVLVRRVVRLRWW